MGQLHVRAQVAKAQRKRRSRFPGSASSVSGALGEGLQGEPGNPGARGAFRGGFRFPPAFLNLMLILILGGGGVPDLTILLFEVVRSGTPERNRATRSRWPREHSLSNQGHSARTGERSAAGAVTDRCAAGAMGPNGV